MGKKKAFIDKKRSTTYSLVFRSAEDHEDPATNAEGDRVLVPAGELGGGREAQPPSDPRALYAHFFGDEGEEDVSCGVVACCGSAMFAMSPCKLAGLLLLLLLQRA